VPKVCQVMCGLHVSTQKTWMDSQPNGSSYIHTYYTFFDLTTITSLQILSI
jgi:hypothetical protein